MASMNVTAQSMDRKWIETGNGGMVGGRVLEAGNVVVEVNTRRGQSSVVVPDTMYASLKYEVKHTVSVPPEVSCLRILLKCVNAKSGKEILKDGHSILLGKVDVALTPKNGVVTSTMEVKFNDVSYHHGRNPFAWVLEYYFQDQLACPALVMQSASFQVFARRPGAVAAAATPAKKSVPKPNTLSDFAGRLDDLVSLVATRLNDSERREALMLMAQRLIPSSVFQPPQPAVTMTQIYGGSEDASSATFILS